MLFLMAALWSHIPTKNELEFLEFVHFIGCKSYFLKKDFLSLERKERGEGRQQKEWGRKENKEKGSGEVGEDEVR